VLRGVVNGRCEPVVSLQLVGSAGRRTVVEATVDTGFTEFLSLPQGVLDELGLESSDSSGLVMADGTRILTPLYECVVVWLGQHITVSVNHVEGQPLVGMALIWEHLLTIEATRFGAVTLAPLIGTEG